MWCNPSRQGGTEPKTAQKEASKYSNFCFSPPENYDNIIESLVRSNAYTDAL
jgi:hypothetical protein